MAAAAATAAAETAAAALAAACDDGLPERPSGFGSGLAARRAPPTLDAGAAPRYEFCAMHEQVDNEAEARMRLCQAIMFGS